MSPIVPMYLAYVALSLLLTTWVARTLFRNGALFLVEVFDGDEKLAKAVNHLLVVGFLLINIGYISFALRVTGNVDDARQAIEALSRKLGAVTLVVGVMHFTNVFLLQKMRRRSRRGHAPEPLPAPAGWGQQPLPPYPHPHP
jgi:hypothetical protein